MMADDERAIAVLFSYDPEEGGRPTWDVFYEEEGQPDPITSAELLMLSSQDDFPRTRLWVYTGNRRAQHLRSKTLLHRLGIED